MPDAVLHFPLEHVASLTGAPRAMFDIYLVELSVCHTVIYLPVRLEVARARIKVHSARCFHF